MKTADAITHIGFCNECGSNKFKRIYKKTFPATFGSNGQDMPAPGKVEWRVFECKQCGEMSHVCNIDNDVKATPDSPCLPPSAYEWFFSLEDGFGFETYINDQVPEDYVRYDDLRDEHLFGIIERLQSKYGLLVGNTMENAWNLSLDVSRKAEFPDFDSLHKYIMDALVEVLGPNVNYHNGPFTPDEEYKKVLYKEAFFDIEEHAAFLKDLYEGTEMLDIKLFKFGG